MEELFSDSKDTDESFEYENEYHVHHEHHHSHHSHKRHKKNHKLRIALIVIACIFVALGITGAIGINVAKKEVNNVKQQAYELKGNLKNVMSAVQAQNPEAALSACDMLDESVTKLNQTMDGGIWKFAAKFPATKGYITSVKQLLNAVNDASSEIVRPAIQVLSDYPMSGLKVDDGFSISTINAYIALLEDIEPKIDEISETMKNINLPMGLNSMISDYADQLVSMTTSYDDAKEFLPLFQTFVGDGSDRTYLLTAQNSSELRASGGFPGSIGTIRIRDGILTIGDFQSEPKVLAQHTSANSQITDLEYELFGAWIYNPRDACFDPDFERTGYIWAVAYEERNNENVDGVVSLTPTIIQDLLGIVGDITLSDGTELTSENATKVLQYDLYYKYLGASYTSTTTQTNKYSYVDDLFSETAKTAMAKLVDNFDIKKVSDYYKILANGAKKRTVMMWMKDADEQELVRNAGYAGTLNLDPENPETGVYFNFTDPCKLGWFLDINTEISEPVINDDGTRTYEVTATYGNVITNDDITNGSTYIIGNYGGRISGYAHIFAPAGGTISDFKASNGGQMHINEYHGHQVAYMFGIGIAPGSQLTITYKVTTAAGVTTPLGVNTTPTLQDYR